MRTEIHTSRVGDETKDRKVRVNFFDSLDEQVQHVPEHPYASEIGKKNQATREANPRAYKLNEEQWYGIKYSKLNDAIVKGWPEGVKLLEEIDMPTVEAMTSRRRRAKRGDHGAEVDATALVSGRYNDAWIRHERSTRTGVQRVTLAIDLSCDHTEEADRVKWQGAAALRLTDALEAAGFRVRILAVSAATKVQKVTADEKAPFIDVATVTQVKSYEQPINMATLAAGIVLTGFNRVHGYKMLFADIESKQSAHTGYVPSDGAFKHPSFADRLVEKTDGEETIVAPKIRSLYDAKAWIDSITSKFN